MRVLDSALEIQPLDHSGSTGLNKHAGTHSGGRKRHTAAPSYRVHAETDCADLQPPIPALPDRHAAPRRCYRHHALALLSAGEDRTTTWRRVKFWRQVEIHRRTAAYGHR